jgi:UPF0755 protein
MRLFLRIAALFVLLCIGGYGWYRWSLLPVDAQSVVRVTIRVESGLSTGAIAQLLAQQGVIRSPLAFRLLVEQLGADGKLQAGTFVLGPAMSAETLVDALRQGKSMEIALTIPEGFTVADIDALLVRKRLAGTGAFLRCALECDLSLYAFLPSGSGLSERGGRVEGYLFPDTYFVGVEQFSVEVFLKRMLATFRNRVIDALGSDIGSSGRSLHAMITMASLIEEEAKTDEERPVIAGILWKRFDDDRGLGVDATVRYVLGKPTAPITAADLNVDSPYNTRKFRGLPPGPIASPGLWSIEAALRPSDSPYWYYLHDRNGQIHYAVTNEEHNLNRMEYLGKGNR